MAHMDPQMDPRVPLPPQSVEAEQCLLGALMLNPRAWDSLSGTLREEDFYRQTHRLIWRAMSELSVKGETVDALTVADWFADRKALDEVENGAYLTMLANETPGTSNVAGWADVIRNKSMLRTLIEVGTEIADSALNSGSTKPAEIVEVAQRRLFELTEFGQSNHEHTLKDGIRQATAELMTAMENPDQLRGITTGFRDLDEHFGGFQQPDLIVIGARPAMGKTSLLLRMGQMASLAGHPTGTCSTEQPLLQLAQRHLASYGRVSLTRMRSGRINDQESAMLIESGRKLAGLPYWVFDQSGPSISEIVRVARKWRSTYGIRALYLDYLQRIKAPGDNKTEQVGFVAQSLKTLAREIEIPVITLAQVNREVEKRHDKRPGMADLRNSGEIEQEADLICFLYRDEVYNPESMDKGIAEIIVEKNRHGYTGVVRVGWAGEYVLFQDLAGEYGGQG